MADGFQQLVQRLSLLATNFDQLKATREVLDGKVIELDRKLQDVKAERDAVDVQLEEVEEKQKVILTPRYLNGQRLLI